MNGALKNASLTCKKSVNLVHDRGTHFGLQSKGRVKSILMSMPPLVRWEYDFMAEKGSAEEKLLSEFLVNKNWL